jgi:hypothetical protein
MGKARNAWAVAIKRGRAGILEPTGKAVLYENRFLFGGTAY